MALDSEDLTPLSISHLEQNTSKHRTSHDSFVELNQLCSKFENLKLASDSDNSINSSLSSTKRNLDISISSLNVVRKIDFEFETSMVDEFSCEFDYASKISLSISQAILQLIPILLTEESNVLRCRLSSCFMKPLLHMKHGLDQFKPETLLELHSSIAEEMFKQVIHCATANDLILLSSTLEEMDNLSNDELHDKFVIKMKPYLLCIIRLVTVMLMADEHISADCSCVWKFDAEDEQLFNELKKYSALYEAKTTEGVITSYDSSDLLSDDLFYTPPSSVNSSNDSPRLLTPTEGPVVFIDG